MKSLSAIRNNFKTQTSFVDKIILALIFFIWGCFTQLNDITLPHLFEFGLNLPQIILLQFIFFAAYLIMSYPSAKIIDRFGYKNGLFIGLSVCALGSLMFYFIVGTNNFYLYLISLFITGSGVTFLQIAGNGYIILTSEPTKAASNLTFLQVFNSFGRLLIIVFSTSIFFILSGISIEDFYSLSPDDYIITEINLIQTPYLWMGFIIFFTAILIYFSKLPEIKTSELPILVDTGAYNPTSVWYFKHTNLAALAIFLYVGAEVSIGTYLVQYMSLPNVGGRFLPDKESIKMLQYYWGSAFVGRIIGGFILKDISLRKVTTGFAFTAAIFALISIVSYGKISMVSLIAIGFFNSILFPCLFTLGTSGLGHFLEEGSGVLIASIVGGAIVPFLLISLAGVVGLQLSFLVIVVCYLLIALYGALGSNYKSIS